MERSHSNRRTSRKHLPFPDGKPPFYNDIAPFPTFRSESLEWSTIAHRDEN